MLVGDDGRVKQIYARGDRRTERPRYRLDGRGRTLIPGLIDAHGHVMGLGLGALQLDLCDTSSLEEAQREDRRNAAANPPRAGSSAAAGTRSTGGSADSRPRPISTRWSATGRSGSSGSTDMPAGRTAWRCGRPGSTPQPGASGRQDRGGRRQAERDLRRRRHGPDRAGGAAAAAAAARPGACLGRRRSCSPTDSPRSPTWAPASRIGDDARAGDGGLLRVRIISYASGIDNLLAVAGTRPTPGSMTGGCE